jgi:hypothetical protein
MKRHSLIGIAAVTLMLTACSQDDLVSGTGAITFNSAYVDNQTRADNSITTDNISKIYVYGYRTNANGASAAAIFKNEEVTKGTSGWDYKNTQYWVKDETFAFTAITPSSDKAKWTYNPSTTMIDGKGTLEFNNEDVNADYDLCTAVKTVTPDIANYSTAVAFTLQHRLARVQFKLQNSYENISDKIEVSKLQLNGAISQGTLTTSATEADNKWDTGSSTFNITLADATNKIIIDANTKDTDWSKNTVDTDTKFLIPDGTASNAKASYNVELYAEVKNGNGVINVIDKTGDDAATITIDEGFQAGCSYTILVNFTGDEIKFTVTSVATWGDYEEITQNASANASVSARHTNAM